MIIYTVLVELILPQYFTRQSRLTTTHQVLYQISVFTHLIHITTQSIKNTLIDLTERINTLIHLTFYTDGSLTSEAPLKQQWVLDGS
ncbi:hypothetical protein RclHR1_02820005 [Rhizophagus clarus]|uniref:Uncharacterized protein n=1 Tax=Rhizophagus clarus TaxID=94130 RepID=A0A2Z6R791_9GLOM|nr:hypothetical protein RclHR1_02820005 [Rhizophagus clarus]